MRKVLIGIVIIIFAYPVFGIVNGSLEYGYSAVGGLMVEGQYLATGILIDSQWVLTTAHSVSTWEPDAFNIGSDVSNPTTSIAVDRIFVHHTYDPENLTGDVALVHLSNPTLVTPIHRCSDFSSVSEGSTFTLVGFGRTGPLQTSSTGIRRSGSVDIDSMAINTFSSSTSSLGCGPCIGDSGAAAIMTLGTQQVMGLTSASDENCSSLGYYQRVDYYAPWIDSVMSAELPNTAPSAPELIAPADGSIIIGNSVTFAWLPSNDEEGDSISYTFYISSTDTFGDGIQAAGLLVLLGLPMSAAICRPGNRRRLIGRLMLFALTALALIGCPTDNSPNLWTPIELPPGALTYEYSGLISGSSYQWKIVAVDHLNAENESSIREFSAQ